MNYEIVYEKLIEKARKRNKINEYFEIHHIIPLSMGGSNDESNLVKLTLREHYFAHELLVEMYPECKELSCALWIMTITTLGSLEKAKIGEYDKRKNRAFHFIEEKGKNIRISSREYRYARSKYRDTKLGKVYTSDERKNVSNGTKKAMQDKDVINKCISGSKGCHYYRNKIDGTVHKWFPGDEDIDLTIYEWGRGPMSEKQKEKIGELSKLSKKYYIIPNVNSKYTAYEDFVKKVPEDWEEKWTNESNSKLRKIIISAVREFNINTSFKYDGKIIFRIPNRSKNFKIITPSLYVVCNDIISKWREKDISVELSKEIEVNIEEILRLNKEYMNIF